MTDREPWMEALRGRALKTPAADLKTRIFRDRPASKGFWKPMAAAAVILVSIVFGRQSVSRTPEAGVVGHAVIVTGYAPGYSYVSLRSRELE